MTEMRTRPDSAPRAASSVKWWRPSRTRPPTRGFGEASSARFDAASYCPVPFRFLPAARVSAGRQQAATVGPSVRASRGAGSDLRCRSSSRFLSRISPSAVISERLVAHSIDTAADSRQSPTGEDHPGAICHRAADDGGASSRQSFRRISCTSAGRFRRRRQCPAQPAAAQYPES
jgi:hypothetical protein